MVAAPQQKRKIISNQGGADFVKLKVYIIV